ncbi:MAG: DegV family protein, partial [Erysipelotrichaceae bacterium]|nr:DegV family protein [Erysipelotrichaceae bacterium]
MYKIISDSSCDLSPEQIERYNVHVVPFYVHVGDKEYKENVDIQIREFYQFMVDHKDIFPKSSTPSVNDYVEAFKLYLDQGMDIICICITIKFSGSYNAARLAKESIEEDYPDRKITIINCTFNTVLQGIYTIEAAKMCQSGVDYDQCVERLETIKTTGRIFFTVGNFDYLIHGGRIGKVAKVASSLLGIRPLIVLKEGEIFAFGVSRKRKESINRCIKQVLKHFKENKINPSDYVYSIGYGYDQEEGPLVAAKFKEEVLKVYPDADLDITVMQIGSVIAVHTGPYPIGIT